MDFLGILKEIDSIISINKRKPDEAQSRLQKLLSEVEKDHEGRGIPFLKQALMGYGLVKLLDEQEQAAPAFVLPSDQTLGAYKLFFDKALYQTILPLCQLAHLYESNGTAEDHAFKLSTLFKDGNKILSYLLNFKEGNPFDFLVHDACLFELPPPESCNFQRWKDIANRTQNNRPVYMLNPRFRELLPHAPALERIELSGLEEAKQGKTTPDKHAIDAKIKEINAVHQDYKRLSRTPQRTDEQKAEQREGLKQLASKRSQLRLELAELCAGMTLEQADMPILQAFYEKYQSGSKAAHQLLVKHGISEKEIATFHSLTRRNDDMAIPNIIIDGEKIGYPGLYLKKLDTLSDQGAALAACLGKITRCCQYLGGAGAACATHGISSPNGGFYLVCEGNAHNPSLDDPIFAQAWTWRSERGALCCDSIEVSRSDKEEVIADMYRYFAHELCNREDYKHYNVSQINTGASSGISNRTGSEMFPVTTEHPIDYNDYSDSTSQLLLADATIPYLFYGQTTSQAFEYRIQQETQAYFKTLVAADAPMIDNTLLIKTVYLLLKGNQKELLAQLKELAGERLVEVEHLVDVNLRHLKALNDNIIDISVFKQGAYLHATNTIGEGILHLAATNPESLKDILELLAEAERLEAVEMTDKYGDTALHLAATTPESLKVILEVYPEAGRLEAVKMTGEGGSTALHRAAETPESLKVILELYPEAERLDAVKMTDEGGRTVLNFAATTPESLKVILASLPEAGRLDAVKMTDRYGNTILHLAATNPESIKVILEVYPEAERPEAVKMTNKAGSTALRRAAETPESLKVILELYLEAERLEAVKMTNKDGHTLLHSAVKHPESLKVILESLTELRRLEAVKMTNKYGHTLLDSAVEHPESLKVILESLPQTERLEAVKMTDKYGSTLFCSAALINRESLKVILASLSEAERLEPLKMTNKYGQTELSLATRSPESLKDIFELLPEAQRLEALKMTNPNGHTVLHFAAINPELLKFILELLPEAGRLEAVKMTDPEGLTVLHFAARSSESLKVILELLPEAERFEDLKMTNELEASLTEFYKVKIKVDFNNLSSQAISPLSLGDRKDEIGIRIFDALKQPSLTLYACQRLNEILSHAKNPSESEFNFIGELEKFFDDVIEKRSEMQSVGLSGTNSHAFFKDDTESEEELSKDSNAPRINDR